MFWATYKATCRRFGVFAGASGPKDLNAELFEPISKHLAGAWEKVFQRQIPSSLDTFIRDVQGILKTFHQTATSGVQDPGRNPAGVNMLNSQLRAELTILADILTPLRALVTEKQRDANREFTPIIQKAMTGAYTVCINERGESFLLSFFFFPFVLSPTTSVSGREERTLQPGQCIDIGIP